MTNVCVIGYVHADLAGSGSAPLPSVRVMRDAPSITHSSRFAQRNDTPRNGPIADCCIYRKSKMQRLAEYLALASVTSRTKSPLSLGLTGIPWTFLGKRLLV